MVELGSQDIVRNVCLLYVINIWTEWCAYYLDALLFNVDFLCLFIWIECKLKCQCIKEGYLNNGETTYQTICFILLCIKWTKDKRHK